MMHRMHNWKESESPHVYGVIGEPAIIINGVPPLPSGSTAPVSLDPVNDSGPNVDPSFGEWMEGREVRKLFGDQYYSGKVVKFDSEYNWYRVIYEDGDSEDLEWHELEDILIPLDISTPLTSLALQRYYAECSTPTAKSNLLKPIKGHIKTVGITERKLELPQITQTSELMGETSQGKGSSRARKPPRVPHSQASIQMK